MKSRLPILRSMLAGIALLHLAGCMACCRPCPEPCPSSTPAQAPSEVHVKGLIAKDQQLKLPQASLTLREALEAVGGFHSEDKKIHPQDCLVGLHRSRDGDDATYYFPLAMVQQDIVGKVLLKGSDKVHIVDWRQTSLTDKGPNGLNYISARIDELKTAFPQTDEIKKERRLLNEKLAVSREFFAYGSVPNAGIKQTAKGNQKVLDFLGQPATDPALVIKITRKTANGYWEVFYLPWVKETYDREINGRIVAGYNNEMLINQLVYADDVYEATTSVQDEPLILAGVLTRLVYDSTKVIHTQEQPCHPRLGRFLKGIIPQQLRPNIRMPQWSLDMNPILDGISGAE